MTQKALWRSMVSQVRRLSSRRLELSSPWRTKDFSTVAKGFQTQKHSSKSLWYQTNFQRQYDQVAQCLDPLETEPVTKYTLLRGSQFFFGGGGVVSLLNWVYVFPFPSLWLNLFFSTFFVSQWVITALGIMEKIELDQNVLYLHLPQLHVQSLYQSLSAWHGSWIAHLPPQQRQHQERLHLLKMINQEPQLLLQVLPSFNYFEGHRVHVHDPTRDTDRDSPPLTPASRRQPLFRPGTFGLTPPIQEQLSLPSSQHWKLSLDTLYVHMSISCCHTIALYQHFRRSMTRLKRTFRWQTLSDLPWKKFPFFFSEGECRFHALLVLRCDFGFAPSFPNVLLRNHFFSSIIFGRRLKHP